MRAVAKTVAGAMAKVVARALAKKVPCAVAIMLAVALATHAGIARAQLAPLRLQGVFSMSGAVAAENVYGEHTGEHVQRTWDFAPQCARGTCRRVQLTRKRSGRHVLDVVVLTRQPSGSYVGQGKFWVPLECAGQVESHGGVATETITVRITDTTLLGTTRFVTGITATYVNTSRMNLTRCPGALGQDAAQYQGRLASPLPPRGMRSR